MNIELTTTERNALVNILRRHEHSGGARSVLEKIEPGYSIGDRFIQRGGLFDRHQYILAKVGGCEVCLVNLETGGYWSGPEPVKNSDNITENEFETISYYGEFKKIGEE